MIFGKSKQYCATEKYQYNLQFVNVTRNLFQQLFLAKPPGQGRDIYICPTSTSGANIYIYSNLKTLSLN